MSAGKTKVLLVDDHKMFRKGLRNLIEEGGEMCVAGEAADGREALDQVRLVSPDVVVMDIHLPGENGIEISRRIRSEFPSVKIIALSSDSDMHLIQNALQAGISGYVIKASAPEELIRSIAEVMDHKVYLCPEVSSLVVNDYMNLVGNRTVEPSKPLLSERERSLLKLIAEGKRNKEIAELLSVAPKSVETYRSRLMKKLGCSSANELTRYAIREGIAAL